MNNVSFEGKTLEEIIDEIKNLPGPLPEEYVSHSGSFKGKF